ncbi:MAG TPA: DUF1464 family protein [Gemmata sp.]|jgi:predicted butyrate kinase (DUF1464 family)|nr:DUF1464 family protein [Gemmata sp.]
MRVAGCDPGTSSLDVLILDNNVVADQVRFEPAELRTKPELPVEWLRERNTFDLIAGPSGYGLPLVHAADCTDSQLDLMSLVRPNEQTAAKGVSGFSAVVRAFRDSGLPVVFLPGVIHLPTVPAYRKLNRIDMGTADKLCVAALALAQHDRDEPACVVEFGSAFTAIMVVKGLEIVDGLGGTGGTLGAASSGAWDGEVAYLLSPLTKGDLFRGGVIDAPNPEMGLQAFCEGFCRTLYGLAKVHGFQDVYYGGRLLQTDSNLVQHALAGLPEDSFRFHRTGDLPSAWVKQAAQGAALLADGLAGGRFASLVDNLKLREASGTVLDWLTHPRAAEIKQWFSLHPAK